MAFNKATSKPKNQFSARLVSNKTNATVSFVNITDDFSRKIFGVANATEVTAEQAEEILPGLLGNERIACIITDTTSEIQTVPLDEY